MWEVEKRNGDRWVECGGRITKHHAKLQKRKGKKGTTKVNWVESVTVAVDGHMEKQQMEEGEH